MTTPYWTEAGGDESSAWNTCILGDAWLPGICTVSVDGVGRDVDKKKTKGKDGFALQDNGATGAKITIEVVLLSQDDWTIWQQILPKIHPVKAGGVKTPLEIQHPEPNVLGIRSIYIKNIRGVPPTAKGGKRYVIDCEEWFPQPKDTKGAGADSKAKAVTPNYNTAQVLPFHELVSQPFAPTGADALDQVYSKL